MARWRSWVSRAGCKNWLDERPHPRVLQRIAVCYLITMAVFLRTGIRGQAGWIAGLLLGYWALMAFAPFPVNIAGETQGRPDC